VEGKDAPLFFLEVSSRLVYWWQRIESRCHILSAAASGAFKLLSVFCSKFGYMGNERLFARPFLTNLITRLLCGLNRQWRLFVGALLEIARAGRVSSSFIKAYIWYRFTSFLMVWKLPWR
jgi:hypothetical protein